MIMPATPLGVGLREGFFFSLKSSPFRFWQWGPYNIFHPSLCFLCSASGIESKPKRQGKGTCSLRPRRQCLGGMEAGTRERVCVWGCGVLRDLWRAVQGYRMHIQRKPVSSSSASLEPGFFCIRLAPTSSLKSVMLVVAGPLQLLRKHKVSWDTR